MTLRLEKEWMDLTAEAVGNLPAQLGVYELSDAGGDICYIGYAGGHSLFGLRSELQRWLERQPEGRMRFRYEVNMQYISRHQELLMLYVADQGTLPARNTDVNLERRGRLARS